MRGGPQRRIAERDVCAAVHSASAGRDPRRWDLRGFICALWGRKQGVRRAAVCFRKVVWTQCPASARHSQKTTTGSQPQIRVTCACVGSRAGRRRARELRGRRGIGGDGLRAGRSPDDGAVCGARMVRRCGGLGRTTCAREHACAPENAPASRPARSGTAARHWPLRATSAAQQRCDAGEADALATLSATLAAHRRAPISRASCAPRHAVRPPLGMHDSPAPSPFKGWPRRVLGRPASTAPTAHLLHAVAATRRRSATPAMRSMRTTT
jgi:hypothetical protein